VDYPPIGLHAFTQGVPMPGAVELFALVAPVYVSALLAFGGALYLSKIGGELEKARSIGRYELRALLGRGGMGEVWEARHRQLARPVAIKLVRPERAQDGISPARFEREAKATARLKSAHTVQLYDYGITERGELFYVMELLEGLDLEALLLRARAASLNGGDPGAAANGTGRDGELPGAGDPFDVDYPLCRDSRHRLRTDQSFGAPFERSCFRQRKGHQWPP
jgi:hypothetical protein